MAGVRDNNIGQGHTRKLLVYCGSVSGPEEGLLGK